MALRNGTFAMRRMLSGTSKRSSAEKLPFEKPLFESEILQKAQQERDSYRKLEMIGHTAVILVGLSTLARIGYYMTHGKEGGAAALPKRASR